MQLVERRAKRRDLRSAGRPAGRRAHRWNSLSDMLSLVFVKFVGAVRSGHHAFGDLLEGERHRVVRDSGSRRCRCSPAARSRSSSATSPRPRRRTLSRPRSRSCTDVHARRHLVDEHHHLGNFEPAGQLGRDGRARKSWLSGRITRISLSEMAIESSVSSLTPGCVSMNR